MFILDPTMITGAGALTVQLSVNATVTVAAWVLVPLAAGSLVWFVRLLPRSRVHSGARKPKIR